MMTQSDWDRRRKQQIADGHARVRADRAREAATVLEEPKLTPGASTLVSEVPPAAPPAPRWDAAEYERHKLAVIGEMIGRSGTPLAERPRLQAMAAFTGIPDDVLLSIIADQVKA